MESSDFYVTLVSSSGLEYNPENTSTDFTNQLSRPICNGSHQFKYEVGLASLSFTPPKISPTKLTEKVKEPVEQKKFFPGASELIAVLKFEHTVVEFSKKEDPVNPMTLLVSDITKHFTDKTTNLEINQLFEEGSAYTVIRLTSSEQIQLTLPLEISSAFGFEQQRFSVGVYKSKKFQNFEEFNKLPVGTKFGINVRKVDNQKEIKINEPSSYSFKQLVANIVEAFEKNEYPIGLVFSKQKQMLTVNIGDEDVNFKFSPVLNNILTLPEGYVFQDPKTQLLVSNQLLDTDRSVSQPPVIPTTWVDAEQTLVQTNIILDQLVGSSSLPILRCIDLPLIKTSHAVYDFPTVHYLPVSRPHVSNIQIKLSDIKGNILPGTSFPTTAVLHFRRRWI